MKRIISFQVEWYTSHLQNTTWKNTVDIQVMRISGDIHFYTDVSNASVVRVCRIIQTQAECKKYVV